MVNDFSYWGFLVHLLKWNNYHWSILIKRILTRWSCWPQLFVDLDIAFYLGIIRDDSLIPNRQVCISIVDNLIAIKHNKIVIIPIRLWATADFCNYCSVPLVLSFSTSTAVANGELHCLVDTMWLSLLPPAAIQLLTIIICCFTSACVSLLLLLASPSEYPPNRLLDAPWFAYRGQLRTTEEIRTGELCPHVDI